MALASPRGEQHRGGGIGREGIPSVRRKNPGTGWIPGWYWYCWGLQLVLGALGPVTYPSLGAGRWGGGGIGVDTGTGRSFRVGPGLVSRISRGASVTTSGPHITSLACRDSPDSGFVCKLRCLAHDSPLPCRPIAGIEALDAARSISSANVDLSTCHHCSHVISR